MVACQQETPNKCPSNLVVGMREFFGLTACVSTTSGPETADSQRPRVSVPKAAARSVNEYCLLVCVQPIESAAAAELRHRISSGKQGCMDGSKLTAAIQNQTTGPRRAKFASVTLPSITNFTTGGRGPAAPAGRSGVSGRLQLCTFIHCSLA